MLVYLTLFGAFITGKRIKLYNGIVIWFQSNFQLYIFRHALTLLHSVFRSKCSYIWHIYVVKPNWFQRWFYYSLIYFYFAHKRKFKRLYTVFQLNAKYMLLMSPPNRYNWRHFLQLKRPPINGRTCRLKQLPIPQRHEKFNTSIPIEWKWKKRKQ